ncbi:unnamed protein product, partial [Ectocarpus sp. 4 AP-2014]
HSPIRPVRCHPTSPCITGGPPKRARLCEVLLLPPRRGGDRQRAARTVQGDPVRQGLIAGGRDRQASAGSHRQRLPQPDPQGPVWGPQEIPREVPWRVRDSCGPPLQPARVPQVRAHRRGAGHRHARGHRGSGRPVAFRAAELCFRRRSLTRASEPRGRV